MRLPKGATGYLLKERDQGVGTDPSHYIPVCDKIAKSGRGAMLSFSPAMTPTSFHTAELALASGKVFLVCHAVLPMIAGVLSPGPSFEEIRFCDTLLAGRPWDSRPFSILGMDILDMPIEMADLSLLSSAELRDVRFWEPDTVGQLLFNYWD